MIFNSYSLMVNWSSDVYETDSPASSIISAGSISPSSERVTASSITDFNSLIFPGKRVGEELHL